MSWHEDSQTLQVGPVPVTMPELAIALELRFDDGHLLEVEASMPNGEVYVFDSLPPE